MAAYAVSDIHGHYPLWQKVKEFLLPDDMLFVLGDCADRGSKGWQIIKEVISDPRCYYLKGNHEDMLAKTMKEWENEDLDINFHHLMSNGGYETFNDYKSEDPKFSAEWRRRLEKLPEIAVYRNLHGQEIYLTHAGYTPSVEKRWIDFLWGRDHFGDSWPEEEIFENVIMVHGHTPTDCIAEELGLRPADWEVGAFWYCDDHKVCIDNGTHWSNSLTLLDLITWEEQIFCAE